MNNNITKKHQPVEETKWGILNNETNLAIAVALKEALSKVDFEFSPLKPFTLWMYGNKICIKIK